MTYILVKMIIHLRIREQDNQQERLDFGITQKDSVDQKLRMSEDLIR